MTQRDDREGAASRSGWRNPARWLAIGGTLLTVAAVTALAYSVMSSSGKPKKASVQTIAVLRPPPPPPPPKPEEKPPEPEVKKEEVKLPDPEPKEEAKDEPPPAGPLGLDAEGGAGADGFGLQGRPGGRDITTIGDTGNGGGGRMKFALYTRQFQSHLQEELQKRENLRNANYRMDARLWITPDGRIERVQLVRGTGNPEVDEGLRIALSAAPPLRDPPPPDMPQPITIRIDSRGAG